MYYDFCPTLQFQQPTNYILVTDAASEPLSLSEVKDYLKVSGTDFDDQITNLIVAVRQYGEIITGRDFVNKTWKTYLDVFPSCNVGINIRRSKLQSITSIEYYTSDVLTAYSSANYYITDESGYASIYLKSSVASWPTVDDRKQAAVITFVSGYGADATSVPDGIKQAMLSQIAALFDNYGDCAVDDAQFKGLYQYYILGEKFLRTYGCL